MKKWTEKDNKKLKKMLTRRKQPLTVEEAADAMGRTAQGVRRHVQRLKTTPIDTYGRNAWEAIVVCLMLACVLAMGTATARAAARDPNDPGITLWVLGGPAIGDNVGTQEVRLGYRNLLPDIEVAFGLKHLDAPESGVEHWPVRGYLLAHALDANMLASVVGNKIKIPEGDIYGGLFAEYTYDRDKEFAGGYVIGGEVSWPKGWKTVAEYDATVFNASDNAYEFIVGLKKEF
jgi:hypothetical protein